MRRAILPLIAVMLLLLTISLTSNKLNLSQIIEINGKTEITAGVTPENQIATESGKAIAQAGQNPNEQCTPEEENQQTIPPNEKIQTLQNPTQGENITPPDGRIYYPTSSEEPYAYTPTQTPKETNFPLTPTEPEN